MADLLARETEQACRKRSRLRKALIARSPPCSTVIDFTTLREATSKRACASNVPLEQ